MGALFWFASACHSADDAAAPDGSADAPPAIDALSAPDASPNVSVCLAHGNLCADTNTAPYECAAPSDDPGCPSEPLPSPVHGFCCVPNDCRRAGGFCGDVEAGAFG